MTAKNIHYFAGLLIVGLLSACGSGSNDTASPNNTQETVVTGSYLDSNAADSNAAGNDAASEDSATVRTEGTPAETIPVTSGNVDAGTFNSDAGNSDAGNSDAGDSDTGDSEPESNNAAIYASSDENATQNTPQNADTGSTDSEPSVANNQQVDFGNAKLLVDLVPNGDSYPAKFHRAGDKLYFWTVDTDPRFARCSWHWGWLNDDNKSTTFNLVATHPDTGAVAMNKPLMTLGDFAEDANNACAGFNGTITQVYHQNWTTSQTATDQQQLVVHFDSYRLGPNQVWTTNGSKSNTSLLTSGRIAEQLVFDGDKVFYISADGLSVSNTPFGDRRKLYESDGNSTNIKQIANASTRHTTFEMTVGENRYQLWTYDLDTDEWEKKFSIKPDTNTYRHYETLLVEGDTILSLGSTVIDQRSALGFSSNYGDVTSFDILSNLAPEIYYSDSPRSPYSSLYSGSKDGNHGFVYGTTDRSAEPPVTSIWSYREKRLETLFSMPESGLQDRKVIAGHNGRIYVTGTRQLRSWPDTTHSLELWSYDTQTRQLVELSNNDWYAVTPNQPTPDEAYTFRYLNTPDGLLFVNLKRDTGRELWFTDGSPEGTRQLTDINPGTGNSDPEHFYHSGDAIYFSANDGIHGHEPWMIQISR